MNELAQMCIVFGFCLASYLSVRALGGIEAFANRWLDWQMKLHKERKDEEWSELLVQSMPRNEDREGQTPGHSVGKEASK